MQDPRQIAPLHRCACALDSYSMPDALYEQPSNVDLPASTDGRSSDVDHKAAHSLNHWWQKDTLTYVEYVTLSFGDELPCNGPGYLVDDIPKTTNAVPRRMFHLIIGGLQFPSQTISMMRHEGLNIGGGESGSTRVHENFCCNVVEDSRAKALSPSNTLKFIGGFGDSLETAPLTPWDGDTVTVANGESLCMQAALVFLGAPSKGSSCSMWPRVTALRLVAKTDFIMKFSFKMLKAMMSSRRKAAGHQNLGKNDAESDGVGSKKIRHIMVPRVHGLGLLRKERESGLSNG